jgi:DNA helicase-2/ATP-dependent DNA helicase PcrA
MKDQPFIDEIPYRLVKWLDTPEAKKWVKRFRTIIVDEFQDINDIQWQLIKGFYHPGSTMTIVGDDAQNIYTWRGSSVNFILDFHNNIAGVTDYQLCRNYRSTEAIVTIANSVMRFIPTLPFKEKMIANKRGGRKPEVHFFFRSSDEYDWTVRSIERLLALSAKEKKGYTFAVLSRYNSD